MTSSPLEVLSIPLFRRFVGGTGGIGLAAAEALALALSFLKEICHSKSKGVPKKAPS